MTIVEALVDRLGNTTVLRTEADMAAFTEDWRGRYRGKAACVVLPSTTEQVAAVVRLCVEHGVAMVPQGGNTSLCGGAVPDAAQRAPVIVSLGRMRRVRSIDPANNSMVVEAGCVLAAVQQAAAEARRLYPVSLGAEGSCQIGGTIATNAGGTGVLRWGGTRDNVLGLEVVLPNGAIWHGLQALRKNNTGLDLKQLFIGTEGTMGIITAATLKLHPLPTHHVVAWFSPTDPEAAVTVLGRFQARCGAQLSAYEMMDAHQLELVLAHVPGRRRPSPHAHRWHVLVELSDTGSDGVLDQALQDILAGASEDGLVDDAIVAASEAQRGALWGVRHSVSEANKKAGIGLTTDCAVPVSAVPAFIAQATDAVRRLVPDMPVAVVAHLGDGNAHFIPFYSFEQWKQLPDQDAAAQAVRHAVNDVAYALGGTFSAEHGIGRTQLAEMRSYKSAVELDLMLTVRQAVDPRGLLNPGRLVPEAVPGPDQP